MAELIGASIGTTLTEPDLRREILTFDRIARFNLNEFKDRVTDDENKTGLAADFQFLIDRGVMYEPPIVFDQDPTEFERVAVWTDLFAAAERLLKARTATERSSRNEKLLDTLSRFYACEVREQHQVNAVPILINRSLQCDKPAIRNDVVHLVLNELPIPGPTHSLEDILAFRDEARSEGLIRLRCRTSSKT
jgi:hypothetical protein